MRTGSRLAGVLAVAVAIGAPALAQTDPSPSDTEEFQGETVEVNLVELFAVATRRSGKPVRGLGADDFVVRLDGRELPIERVREGDQVPLRLGLLVDSSDSMGPVMDDTRAAAHRFLDRLLAADDRALVVDVDTTPRLVHGLTGDRDELAEAFDALEVGGDTALYDAIALGVEELSKVPGRRALVALTDGRDVGSRWDARRCRRLAQRAGVPVYFLSIANARTTSSNAMENLRLASFARATGGDLYWIVSDDEVVRAYDALEDELRNQYVLGVATDRALDDDELAGIEIGIRGHGGFKVRAARRGGG